MFLGRRDRDPDSDGKTSPPPTLGPDFSILLNQRNEPAAMKLLRDHLRLDGYVIERCEWVRPSNAGGGGTRIPTS